MATIHWAGTGLSAIPGLRRLIKNGHRVIVYNRSIEKAQQAIAGLNGDAKAVEFDMDTLKNNISAGDVIVSMLPADYHPTLAQLALQQGAHFVSSSYISDQMRELDTASRKAGLCMVNEVGLDPGIDHSMAHALVADYQASEVFDKNNLHFFTSYCGGLSKQPNDFCYRFSWSPLGVLRALKSPSVSIRDGVDYVVNQPWSAIEQFPLDMPWGAETFEVYPNRDSRPFMSQYHFSSDWKVEQFVRGTLRYKGWKQAWRPIFDRVEQGMSDAELNELSDQLWQKYKLEEGEADRVVMAVTLMAKRDGRPVWHQSYLLDAFGNEQGSAMARLVSIPLSLAVEAMLQGEIDAGVSAAPDSPELVARWLDTVNEISDHFTRIDHLAQ
jgi:saccharopine dehydrogenase-like NADP-dependent oxidoreductase